MSSRPANPLHLCKGGEREECHNSTTTSRSLCQRRARSPARRNMAGPYSRPSPSTPEERRQQQHQQQRHAQSSLLNAAIAIAHKNLSAAAAAFAHSVALAPGSPAATAALDAAESFMARAANHAQLARNVAAALIVAHSMRPAASCSHGHQPSLSPTRALQEEEGGEVSSLEAWPTA